MPIKPEIVEINEKYGAMVIDYRGIEGCFPEVSTIINKYEDLSEKICEVCGGKGSIKDVGGWLTAYCTSCYESAQAEHEEMLAVRKAKQEREFTGGCYSCGTQGAILRDLGNEVRIGYCDPYYEKVKLNVEERERRANELFSRFNPHSTDRICLSKLNKKFS